MRIIKAGEIKLNYSMKQAIDATERAFTALSAGDCHVPVRTVTRAPSGELLMLFKPAFVEKDKKATVKFITQREGNSVPGRPAIQGIVMVHRFGYRRDPVNNGWRIHYCTPDRSCKRTGNQVTCREKCSYHGSVWLRGTGKNSG